MILESLSYLFHSISCPSYLKKLGLLQDLIAIDARSKRLASEWQPHLQKTKDFISSRLTLPADKTVVFGAGLLNDLPLKALSETFKEVKLYDIFFLQDTINKIREFSNVDFIELDITNTLASLVNLVDKHEGECLHSGLQDLCFRYIQDFNDFDADMVISLNLLSQLNLPAKSILQSDENYTELYESYIKNHLDLLKSFKDNGKEVILISDIEKYVCDIHGKEQGRESSVEAIDITSFGFKELDSWDWQLAPYGELDPDYSLSLLVKGYC